MKKKDLYNVYLGMIAQFDQLEDMLKACCYAVMFIEKKKLFAEYLKYCEKNFPKET